MGPLRYKRWDGAVAAAVLLFLGVPSSPAGAASIVPLSQLRSAEADARAATLVQDDLEASFDQGPFDATASARTEAESTLVGTVVSHVSDSGAAGVTADAKAEPGRMEDVERALDTALR